VFVADDGQMLRNPMPIATHIPLVRWTVISKRPCPKRRCMRRRAYSS
jgi:hypothetical protein